MKKKLQKKAAEIKAAMQNLIDENPDGLSNEQQEQFDGYRADMDNINKTLQNLSAMDDAAGIANFICDDAVEPQIPFKRDSVVPDTPIQDKPIIIPAQAKRWSGSLESFKGPGAEERAYKAGMWLAATLCNSQNAAKWCKDHGMPIQWGNLQNEGSNTAGGYLVYPEYERDIIKLVEEYGVARQLLKITPMMSDVKNKPRRTGGVTAYFVGEGAQITESAKTWDNVKLIAKKLAAISVASNEIISDAIISLADDITQEIALAFATKEDDCTFAGDGTSTYGGIVGIRQKLSTINGVDDGGGLVLADGNTFAEITDANLTKMIGQVPNYPGLRPVWVCSKPFWAQVLVRLIRATGGATMMEMRDGTGLVPQYAGYPVVWTSGTTAMPVSDANSQIACLFGDFRMSAMFGDRAGMTIATSTEATVGDTSMFDTDSFAIRGVERFDINVHDVGSATAAGPVVGLITASS